MLGIYVNMQSYAFSSLQTVTCEIKHKDGSTKKIELKHSMNKGQIEWFHAGALNRMKELNKQAVSDTVLERKLKTTEM